MRHWVGPGEAAELLHRYFDTDVGELLPTVRVPTLLLAREGWGDPDEDDHIAATIPDANLALLPGRDPASFTGDHAATVEAIERFLGLAQAGPNTEAVLQTVLFTDIVGATEVLNRIGDRAWKELIERHHAVVRESSSATEASRPTRSVTASTRPSTAPPARSGAPSRWSIASGTSASRSARVSTRASAR